MRGYMAFVKKEFMENTRTYKLLILFAVFLIFGMMGPVIAKLTPELIKSMDLQGIPFTIPVPTAKDSYIQFFKNDGQMGLLILVLIFGGTLTREYTKGTLINVLTKGLPRKTVIFAKYTVGSILWTVSLVLSLLTTYGYTVYLFPNDNVYNIVPSVGCLWIFGLFLLAVIIFASTLVESSYSCLLITALILILLFTINIVPAIVPYNPVLLASGNVSMLEQGYDFSDVIKSLSVTIVAIVGLIWAAVIIFNKKKI
ncbi:ABC transporter permease [[Clostridium] fimetarium]|uniref:ABC-2 type transport system permease protein n=1 Tax=[Clostridium] fimetarium TaxID=99656 RepID=A0A1I0R3Y9_9FIRM|nr:ABC transporter permease subunit [[Clostridium] fimetarium]SEW34679.1 ABC-2 type transport system permease protein [[Clostridium] fimetarium]